ncbi:MAG TPA: nucleotide sugar dehydrogenase [Symbiobacteriaceae bacterium]|jgi:UDP-N-acetyl-D-mannosaminuronic acid dehydrogenase
MDEHSSLALQSTEPVAVKNIAVIGLGFVGLPLALSLSMSKANVTGVDALPGLINQINLGRSDMAEWYEGERLETVLQRELHAGRFRATTNLSSALATATEIIVTVGLPVRNGHPDTSALETAAREITKYLKPGDLVLLRSTVVPGTTEGLVQPILEESGLKAGQDFYLAYAPERIAEGNAFDEFASMPTIVAGVNEDSTRRAISVLKLITRANCIVARSIMAAETSKVIENLSRDINLAMVNEFARFFEAAGIDTFETLRLANTHPRVRLLKPGLGVGGYCIPYAYYYLAALEGPGRNLQLGEMARSINDAAPKAILDLARTELAAQGKSLMGARLALMGLAMKDYSNDMRLSPAVQLAHLAMAEGAQVRGYDPLMVEPLPFKTKTLEECLSGADVVIYAVRQAEFERMEPSSIPPLLNTPAVIIDTRGDDRFKRLSGPGVSVRQI